MTISHDQIWNGLPMPALLMAEGDIVLALNPAAEVFFNLSSDSVSDEELWSFATTKPQLTEAFAQARKTGRPLFVTEVALGAKTRPSAPCNIQFTPLQDGPKRYLLTLQPIEVGGGLARSPHTQRAAKSAIGMAEMLAHEIKNPLAGITGAAQLLSMTLDDADRALTDLIVDETHRIVGLLNQVEEFGNTTSPDRQLVNLHDVIDRARQSAALGFGSHMRFVEDYDPSLPSTYADPDHLVQVLLNLVKNACEVGASGGTITLRTFYDASLRRDFGGGVVKRLPLQIEVIDDGPGLPEDIAGHVFEPFVSGKENGTGLGLALVSKLILDNGGWVSVDRIKDRTIFRISLPRAPERTDKTGD